MKTCAGLVCVIITLLCSAAVYVQTQDEGQLSIIIIITFEPCRHQFSLKVSLPGAQGVVITTILNDVLPDQLNNSYYCIVCTFMYTHSGVQFTHIIFHVNNGFTYKHNTNAGL